MSEGWDTSWEMKEDDADWRDVVDAEGWEDPLVFVPWVLEGWDELDPWQAEWVGMITGRDESRAWANPNLAIMAGTGTGKSETVLGCQVWDWLWDPSMTALLFMVNLKWCYASVELLKQMVAKVGKLTDRLRIDNSRANTMGKFSLVGNVSRAASMDTSTSLGSTVSIHVNRIWGDDPASYALTRSANERDRLFQSISSQPLRRRKKGSQVVFTSAAWHGEDPLHRVIGAGFNCFVGSSHEEDVGQPFNIDNENHAVIQLARPHGETDKERAESERLDPIMHKIQQRSDATVRGGGLLDSEAMALITGNPFVRRFLGDMVEWDGEQTTPRVLLTELASGRWLVLGIDMAQTDTPSSSYTAVALCWVVTFPDDSRPYFAIVGLGKWKKTLGESVGLVGQVKDTWRPTYAAVESSGGDEVDESPEGVALQGLFMKTPLIVFDPGGRKKNRNIIDFTTVCYQGHVLVAGGDGPLRRELLGQIRDLSDATKTDFGDLVSAVLAAWSYCSDMMKRGGAGRPIGGTVAPSRGRLPKGG